MHPPRELQPHELQVSVTIAVAIASLIIVPALLAIARRLWIAWKEAEHARLVKLFVPREEMDMQFEELTKKQAEQHQENRDFLDTIRTEAQQREGKILGSIEAVSNQNRHESQRLGTDIANLGKRVDRLFERHTQQ